ncbi:hypothetical protein [Sphingobacterium suaedae]|uniref:Uncharacterized protein n=1 Tax=Sphingobacterium suaedae TaxID=1686402 RepID=A0ABW5KM18_9SPHI
MLLKLVHYFVLLCYVNIIAYEGGGNTVVHQEDSLLNGESLLEFVLDDVLDLPVDEDAKDVEIRYDEYRSISYQYFVLPLFVLVLGTFLTFQKYDEKVKHPVYDGKKRQIIPGYYRFLYRLKPF